MQTPRARHLIVTSALLLAGCSGGSSDAVDGGVLAVDAGTTDAGAPDAGPASTEVIGTFRVKLAPPVGGNEGLTTVFGKVNDGPTPSALQWQQVSSSGGCTLSTPRVPFCSTSCGGSAVCVADGVCKAYPASQNLGAVTVTGIRTAAGVDGFTMSPISNGYQPPGATELAYPGVTEGAAIHLGIAGNSLIPAFALDSKGIAPLALDGAVLQLQSGSALAVRWTAGAAAVGATIHIKLDISHHGGTKGVIECDTTDTGSLDIPAALITSLKDLGVAGYPTIIVTRQSVGRTQSARGVVELDVRSDVEKEVVIPGLVSCTDNSECTAPQTCQTDLTCR